MKRISPRQKMMAGAWLVGVILVATYFLQGGTIENLLHYTPASPILAALLLWAIYCLKGVTMFVPIASLYLAAGLLFPMHVAILVTYVGLALEATVGYRVGRNMGTEAVKSLVGQYEKAQKILTYEVKNQNLLCFLLRAVPLPLEVPAFFLGATGMPFGNYLAFSLLGLTPTMILRVLAGTALDNPLSKEFIIPFTACYVINFFVGHTIKKVDKKRQQKMAAQREENTTADHATTAPKSRQPNQTKTAEHETEPFHGTGPKTTCETNPNVIESNCDEEKSTKADSPSE